MAPQLHPPAVKSHSQASVAGPCSREMTPVISQMGRAIPSTLCPAICPLPRSHPLSSQSFPCPSQGASTAEHGTPRLPCSTTAWTLHSCGSGPLIMAGVISGPAGKSPWRGAGIAVKRDFSDPLPHGREVLAKSFTPLGCCFPGQKLARAWEPGRRTK